MRMMSFYAFVALGLLLNGAMLFRYLLLCCAVHEMGHIVAYILCTRKLPKIQLFVGGVSMYNTNFLSKKHKFTVLICGPLANIFLFSLFYISAQHNATYNAYIIAACSLCVAIYNILPIGVLDGAQILELFLPLKLYIYWYKIQNILLILCAIILPICAFYYNWTLTATLASCISPAYLLYQKSL